MTDKTPSGLPQPQTVAEQPGLIALAEKCSAEVGRYEGKVVWVKFHSQAAVEAFATGVVMSAAVRSHAKPVAPKAEQAAPQAEATYLEGVNVDRLREVMTFLGIAGYGQEETAARMAECINQVTQGVMRLKASLATPLPAQVQPAEQVGGWRHKANEWADMATNGIQWLRNVRDGISTPEEALVEMEANHDRIQALATPAPQPVSADTAAQGLLEQAEAEVMRCAREAALAVAANKRTHPANWYGVVAAVRRLAALSPQQAEPGKGADRG